MRYLRKASRIARNRRGGALRRCDDQRPVCAGLVVGEVGAGGGFGTRVGDRGREPGVVGRGAGQQAQFAVLRDRGHAAQGVVVRPDTRGWAAGRRPPRRNYDA